MNPYWLWNTANPPESAAATVDDQVLPTSFSSNGSYINGVVLGSWGAGGGSDHDQQLAAGSTVVGLGAGNFPTHDHHHHQLAMGYSIGSVLLGGNDDQGAAAGRWYSGGAGYHHHQYYYDQMGWYSGDVYQYYHQPAAVTCQVEGCGRDLMRAGNIKHYYKRHRICEVHAKATSVLVEGAARRFCQQCSRFQLLSAFDKDKRSCRSRLSDHNKRRRRTAAAAAVADHKRITSSQNTGNLSAEHSDVSGKQTSD